MDPIVLLDKVTKSYTKNKVLQEISLDIFRGEIFGIIGASGSGKTTLLKTIIGYYQPEAGTVSYHYNNKQFTTQKNTNIIRKLIGYAAQKPSVYSKLTVFENLDYFGSLYNLTKEARRTNIKTLLDMVNLTQYKDYRASNLSGGMLRRLDIGCALMHDPDVLILDEPTSDLDPVLASHIWTLLRKINKRGTTIIVASHHLTEIETISSRIGILDNGSITHVGTVAELTGSLSKGQEIRIESYPGNYDAIIKHMKTPLIDSAKTDGHELVLITKKPDKVMMYVLKALKACDESLMDASISKLSLSDVFHEVRKL